MAIFFVFLALPVPAASDSPAPLQDYTKETENGEFLFVMLAPQEWAKYQNSGIRKKYPGSGLYRNDGSTTPLWPVYWYSFEVYPSSDGRHVVRMGPRASYIGELAVSFHDNGKEIKAYRIKDLVLDESKLEHTVSHFFWRSSLHYDDGQGILFLKTKDDRSYRFSIKTGESMPERNAPDSRASQAPDIEAGKRQQPEERVIIRKPIPVIAKLTKEQPPSKETGGSYEFDLTVGEGKEKFTRSTCIISVDSVDQAFKAIKKGTRWNGKYLFVRTECGGGNAWSCNRDAIFMLRAGRVHSLGDVFGGDRENPARSYKDGYFWDIYNKFEMNGLTDHATAPAFRLALLEKAGELQPDLPRTWLRNRSDFQSRMTEIGAFIKTDGKKHDRKELVHLVLSNAVLAKYCERKNEVGKMQKLAEVHFEPGRLNAFRTIMRQVEPGEYRRFLEEE
jgi:hypothetical protein